MKLILKAWCSASSHRRLIYSPPCLFFRLIRNIPLHRAIQLWPLLLTRFDLLDDRFVLAVLHLSDVQQGVGVPVVGGPVVHEDPRTAAAAVHHDAVVEGRVQDVGGLHGLGHGQVAAGQSARQQPDNQQQNQTTPKHQSKAKQKTKKTAHSCFLRLLELPLTMIKDFDIY